MKTHFILSVPCLEKFLEHHKTVKLLWRHSFGQSSWGLSWALKGTGSGLRITRMRKAFLHILVYDKWIQWNLNWIRSNLMMRRVGFSLYCLTSCAGKSSRGSIVLPCLHLRGREFCVAQQNPVQVKTWEEPHPWLDKGPGCGAARGSESLVEAWRWWWGLSSYLDVCPPVENGGETKYAIL